MNKTLQALKYLLADLFSAGFAWSLFYIFRKIYIEPQKYGMAVDLEFNRKFYMGLLLIPIFWIMLYALIGTYREIYRKSRLKELGQTFLVSLIGVTIIFFTVLLDDEIRSYKNYYQSFTALFLLHFVLTFFLRFVLSSITAFRIHNRIIGFNTLLIGSNEKALALYRDLEGDRRSVGFRFLGFIHINGGSDKRLEQELPHLGHVRDVQKIIQQHDIEEVILAIESSEHDSIGRIINELEGQRVFIKVIPHMYDILSGSVKMTSILGAPLIEITHQIMPTWQQSLKRIMDISISMLALIFLSPLYLFLAIMVKLSSPGPIFYSQERIGRYGKPFRILKFRSMFIDAEKNGPALSHEHDPRITRFGRFIRQTRMDELPQFVNVIIGDMALVGPRPERRYFIDKITEEAPHYRHLHKVRPGVTSWGQVKYGYAENVPQMIERLKYDVIYIENMSLFIDIKILIYTVLIVLQGRGK